MNICFKRINILIILTYILGAASLVWAQNESSPMNPPEVDDARLKEKIVTRIQNLNAGKNEAYKNFDSSKVIVEKKILFQMLGQQLVGVRLKIQSVLPDQSHDFCT